VRLRALLLAALGTVAPLAARAGGEAESLYRDALLAETVDRDFAAAIALYEQAAAAATPPHAKAQLRRAQCLETVGRIDEARAAYDAAIANAEVSDPGVAETARWRRDRLTAPSPAPAALPPAPPRLRGPRWEARLDGGYSLLYPARLYGRNDATYASAGFSPHAPTLWLAGHYRLSPRLAVGLEIGRFLPRPARAVQADALIGPGDLVAQRVDNQATYFGPSVLGSYRKRRWVVAGSAGFGTVVQRARIEHRVLTGPTAGSAGFTASGNSDVAIALAAAVERRLTPRFWLGFGARSLTALLREFNDGRAATDPLSRRKTRHLLIPFLRLGVTF
jgi:hypothetical protein